MHVHILVLFSSVIIQCLTILNKLIFIVSCNLDIVKVKSVYSVFLLYIIYIFLIFLAVLYLYKFNLHDIE